MVNKDPNRDREPSFPEVARLVGLAGRVGVRGTGEAERILAGLLVAKGVEGAEGDAGMLILGENGEGEKDVDVGLDKVDTCCCCCCS